MKLEEGRLKDDVRALIIAENHGEADARPAWLPQRTAFLASCGSAGCRRAKQWNGAVVCSYMIAARVTRKQDRGMMLVALRAHRQTRLLLDPASLKARNT